MVRVVPRLSHRAFNLPQKQNLGEIEVSRACASTTTWNIPAAFRASYFALDTLSLLAEAHSEYN